MEDVIIIGGGIASHSAAVYTSRAKLKTLVLCGFEPDQLSLTTLVENYPGFPEGVLGPELVKNARKQAEKFGAKYIDAVATNFEVKKGFYEVKTDKKVYQTKTVIISTGAKPRKLGILGENKYFGKGVSTCAVCLPPDESIIVNSSIRKIKEITPLTKVLTINGTYQNIAGFNKKPYKGKLIKIKTRFFTESVLVTPNHPVLSVKALRDYGHGKYVSFTKLGWIEAGALKRGDSVLYPIIRETENKREIKIADYIDVKIKKGFAYPIIETHTANHIKNVIKIDEDFMRLVGYYLAEGSSHKHMLSFYFSKKETNYINDVRRILKKKFNLKVNVKYAKNVCRITIYSKILCDLFKNLFGAYAYKKHLPHWAVILPQNKQRELVKGMWRGDGCIREKDFCYVTSSRELAYQLRDILLRLGTIPAIQLRGKNQLNKWVNKIEGRLVGFNHDKYHLIVGGQFLEKMGKILGTGHPHIKERGYICRHAWLTDRFAILPIREIEKVDYKGIVLNLGVENNNTYVAKNFIVHNCDAALYKNKIVVVVGGGDSAMEETLALVKFASKVYIIHRRDEFKASKIMQERVLKLKDKVEVIWDSAPTEVLGEKFVNGVKIKNLKTNKETILKADGMFLAIGHIPNTEIFKGKVELDELGFIKTDKRMRTNLPGVFSAGDVQDHVYKQAITSAGTGCMAALEAEWYLETLKATGKY